MPCSAITYVDGYYRVSDEKCTGCLECINPWNRGGCLMAKVLAVKKGGLFSMPYARHETFYIRDGWLRKGLRLVEGERV